MATSIKILACSAFRPKMAQPQVTCMQFRSFTGSTKPMNFFSKKDKETVDELLKEPEEVDENEPKEIAEYISDLQILGSASYKRPEYVEDKIIDLVGQYLPDKNWGDFRLTDPKFKYVTLAACMETFKKDIPNSVMHHMEKMSDVVEYFKTEKRDTTVYEDMAKLDLPKNLHIQLEPIRFADDPSRYERSAFPQTDTIVTSLKFRKKYKSYKWEGKFPKVTYEY